MRAPDFWYRTTGRAHFLGALFSPLSLPYRASAAWKAGAKGYRAKARVVCVGNLTVGGTGKTPVAIALAERLQDMDVRVTFLTRGYGGAMRGPVRVEAHHTAVDIGDEALLLARIAPTVVAKERAKGAELADAIGADVIVMDDGFQNMALVKDLSLLVVDAEQGFGNGHVVPAGPLREPITAGLKRADGVILVGPGSARLPPFAGAVFHAHLRATDNDIAGRRVVAFAGIGRPKKFFETTRALGAELCATYAFSDHHPFRASELAALRAEALAKHALLVTTEKDFVRIPYKEREGMVAVAVQAEFSDEAAIDRFLGTLIPKARDA